MFSHFSIPVDIVNELDRQMFLIRIFSTVPSSKLQRHISLVSLPTLHKPHSAVLHGGVNGSFSLEQLK